MGVERTLPMSHRQVEAELDLEIYSPDQLGVLSGNFLGKKKIVLI